MHRRSILASLVAAAVNPVGLLGLGAEEVARKQALAALGLTPDGNTTSIWLVVWGAADGATLLAKDRG